MQTNTWHREEDPHHSNCHKKSGRQLRPVNISYKVKTCCFTLIYLLLCFGLVCALISFPRVVMGWSVIVEVLCMLNPLPYRLFKIMTSFSIFRNY